MFVTQTSNLFADVVNTYRLCSIDCEERQKNLRKLAVKVDGNWAGAPGSHKAKKIAEGQVIANQRLVFFEPVTSGQNETQ